MFSLLNVSSDFLDYDEKFNNTNLETVNNLISKSTLRKKMISNLKKNKELKVHNYWKLPRLRLKSFVELHDHEKGRDENHIYDDLWYCSSCGHLRPITIEQIFSFISPFIPLMDSSFQSNLEKHQKAAFTGASCWGHIANVRKISQVVIVALEIDVSSDKCLKETMKSANNITFKPKLKIHGSEEEGECSSESSENNISSHQMSESIAQNMFDKSTNTLIATYFPLFASCLLPMLPTTKDETNNEAKESNLVDSPILLPFLPPAGGSLAIDQHFLSLHEQITLASLDILCDKSHKSSASVLSPAATRKPFTYINRNTPDLNCTVNPGSDAGTTEPLPCTSRWDTFPRTRLLANRQTLAEEGYPLPKKHSGDSPRPDPDELARSGFTFSQPGGYDPVCPTLSPLLAVDCEMSLVQGGERALVRVTAVDESLRTVYDTLVKPEKVVTDYLTRYSGVDAEVLKDVTVRLSHVQAELSRILLGNGRPEPGGADGASEPSDRDPKGSVILCGHSLNFDLEALKMYHPYVVDTSMIYNLSGIRQHKSKLKTLAQAFLGKTIQSTEGGSGHDSIEDAATVMELVLLKLRTGINFGDFTKSKRGHKLVLPAEAKPASSTSTNPVAKVEGVGPDPTATPTERAVVHYGHCCASCYPALSKVVENDRLCSSHLSATDRNNVAGEQDGSDLSPPLTPPANIGKLPLSHNRNRLSRQKSKTWQIFLTRSPSDLYKCPDDREGSDPTPTFKKSLSTVDFFPDPRSLLRHHNCHSLDRHVTVSSLRVKVPSNHVTSSGGREGIDDSAGYVDAALRDIYDTSADNSLFVALVWQKSNEMDHPPVPTEMGGPLPTSHVPPQFGSVWVKIKR